MKKLPLVALILILIIGFTCRLLDSNQRSSNQEETVEQNPFFAEFRKDSTPGCTAEACSLRDNYGRFMALGYEVLGLCGGVLFARDLESEISDLTGKLDATVGVALLCGDDALVLNNDVRYPIMSTFKFHIAVTVLHQMEMSGTALDGPVCIEAAQIRETTWSPLREKYPHGSINTTMREVLEYAISHSDNNACDWLIDYAGGISVVDAYVRSLGVDGFCLTETEASMEEDIYRTYNNWSTPLSMAAFLRKVYSGNVLGEEYFRFLEQAMLETNTGLNKLRAGLPDDVPIGHKTGMSFRTPEGVRMCEADSGVIYLPDGRKLYLVVFVKDSTESDDANAKIMADICRVVYEHVRQRVPGNHLQIM